LLDQGLEVVAVEPDTSLASLLRAEFGARPHASVREAAIADRAGTAQPYRAIDAMPSRVYGDTTLFSSLIKHEQANGMSFEPGDLVETLTIACARNSAGRITSGSLR
jgi:hypothetical protein